MKKIFIISSVALFAACNNSGDKAKVDSMNVDTTATAAAKTMPDINSPYPVAYSSKFEIGDPKNAETVLQLWKDWDNNSLMNSRNSFADTVTFYFSDGSMMHASRDSALAMAQKIRDSQASITSSIDAVMSAKSLMNKQSSKPEDQNQNWALIWGEERVTDKKGKKDSSAIMETWGLDKDGKVNIVYQYRKKLSSAKK
jgi:hypothetical protein